MTKQFAVQIVQNSQIFLRSLHIYSITTMTTYNDSSTRRASGGSWLNCSILIHSEVPLQVLCFHPPLSRATVSSSASGAVVPHERSTPISSGFSYNAIVEIRIFLRFIPRNAGHKAFKRYAYWCIFQYLFNIYFEVRWLSKRPSWRERHWSGSLKTVTVRLRYSIRSYLELAARLESDGEEGPIHERWNVWFQLLFMIIHKHRFSENRSNSIVEL